MTRKEKLNGLYQKYNLTKEDTYHNSKQGWTIITRSGIDKIQEAAGIEIEYDIISHDLVNVIIKATGKINLESDEEFSAREKKAEQPWMVDRKCKRIETFGEASPKNTKNGYPVAIAEKRAMSRVVLKLTGFYQEGVYGEDEAWEDAKQFVQEEKKARGFNTGTL